jgi:pimeloyl-ACP methyl ester carboxylesterase
VKKFGDSDPAHVLDRRGIANTLPTFCAHFGLTRAAIVGASLGGMLGITLAAAHPDLVAALVLIDVGHQLEEEGVRRIIEFMRVHESFGSVEEAAEAIRPYLPFRKEVRPDNLRRNLRQRADGRWVWKHNLGRRLQEVGSGQAPDWRRILDGLDREAAAVRCPTLVLRGAASDVLSDEGAQQVATLIPNARLAVLRNAGHLAAGDNPESTISLIRVFLEDVGW